MSGDKYAHVRRLEDDAAALIAAALRDWWRPVKNWHRRREALRLLAEAEREINLIEERRRAFWEAAGR